MNGSLNSNPLCVRASRQIPVIFVFLAARCNSLRVSGRTGLILATGINSESEVRWTEECASSFHLNPFPCRISFFLYVRAFLASINLRCSSEFGLHWRNRIVFVVIDGLPREYRYRKLECIFSLNFVCRLTIASTSKRKINYPKLGVDGITWPSFIICNPLPKFGSGEVEHFKFHEEIEYAI